MLYCFALKQLIVYTEIRVTSSLRNVQNEWKFNDTTQTISALRIIQNLPNENTKYKERKKKLYKQRLLTSNCAINKQRHMMCEDRKVHSSVQTKE